MNSSTKKTRDAVPLFFFRPLLIAALCAALSGGCGYGQLGGADRTETLTDSASIGGIIGGWSGAWYSHYANRKLDSYRIGQWKDRTAILPPEKLALFPDFDVTAPELRGIPAGINEDDYFVFYDDTVYEAEAGDGGNGGWGDDMIFRFIGIVRAVNIFNNSVNNGAIIIEYLDDCYPLSQPDVTKTPLPYFGIYYRVLSPDSIQMANAIVWENLYAGKKYYTETAALEEAIAKNDAENEGEFINWGMVIPQDREQQVTGNR
jgi:hypothetical protein